MTGAGPWGSSGIWLAPGAMQRLQLRLGECCCGTPGRRAQCATAAAASGRAPSAQRSVPSRQRAANCFRLAGPDRPGTSRQLWPALCRKSALSGAPPCLAPADTCTQDYRGGAFCFAWPLGDGTLTSNAYGRSPNCLANAYQQTVGGPLRKAVAASAPASCSAQPPPNAALRCKMLPHAGPRPWPHALLPPSSHPSPSACPPADASVRTPLSNPPTPTHPPTHPPPAGTNPDLGIFKGGSSRCYMSTNDVVRSSWGSWPGACALPGPCSPSAWRLPFWVWGQPGALPRPPVRRRRHFVPCRGARDSAQQRARRR
jgi:hypothetical protein